MSKEEFDIFHHSKTYPKADRIFVTELPKIESIKDNCVFVLDTNALLVPFSTGSDSLEEIAKILTILKNKKQLKIPDQVAREFADNRPKKLGEMFYALNNKRNGISEHKIGSYPLLEGLPEYNETLDLEKQLQQLVSKYRKSIGKVVDTVKNWSWDDPVSLIYRKLFTPEVIHLLNVDEKEVQKDLNYRYLHKIPPGYKDNEKEDSGIGDFLIWLSILDIGKAKKNVVFVSGDVKPDWYHKSNKEPLYPRFELLAEFNEVSDNHSFHMIRLSELLKIMGAKDEVVSEVKVEEQLEQERFATPAYIVAESAVYRNYKSRFGSVKLQPRGSRHFYDFTYFDGDAIETAVTVIALRESLVAARSVVHDRLRKLNESSILSPIFKLDIVLVAPSSDYPFSKLDLKIKELIQGMDFAGLQIAVYMGFLDPNGKYHFSGQEDFLF